MKIPVLVNEHCDVTVHHCRESNGGLFFSDYEEFERCLNFIRHNPEVARKMGQNGYRYLKNNFSWQLIVDRFLEYTNILVP